MRAFCWKLVGLLELRHPRNQLQWQLARIMALNLLNLYTLIFALFNKVDDMSGEREELKKNLTDTYGQSATVDFITAFTEAFLTNASESAWVSYTDTQYSFQTDGFSVPMSDGVTTSLSDIDNNNSVVEQLTTASLPSIVSNPPSTLTWSNGEDFNQNSSTIATTLLAAVTFSRLPLLKTDPRLMASLQPGCFLVQASCPTLPVKTASVTPSMTALSSNAMTSSGIASTAATTVTSPTTAMLISMATTADDNGFSIYDSVPGNSSPVFEETTPFYNDNVTIAELVTVVSPSLGDNTTLPRPREMSTLNALGNETYPSYDLETERETYYSRGVAENFKENEDVYLTSLEPSLDKRETFTLASEMRMGMEHSPLLNLIRAMPGIPVQFSPTLIRYLDMDDEINLDDKDTRKNSFKGDDSTNDRITKQEADMPYALKYVESRNVQRVEQEVHSKAQEVQDTDLEFLDKTYEAQNKGQDVKGKDQIGQGEVHGISQEVQGTNNLFLGRDHEAQNKDQEIRRKSEIDQSISNKNNMVQKIPNKIQVTRGKGRFKRVVSYSDYEAMSGNDLNSPEDGNEIYSVTSNPAVKPNWKEVSTLETKNKTSGKEETSDGTLTEIDEAKHNTFITPEIFYTFTTLDQKEENESVSEVTDQNGLTAEPFMRYTTRMNVTSETEEDARDSTEESDVVADEDSECYIVVCEEISKTMPASPSAVSTTLPPMSTTISPPTTLPLTSSTTTMPPTTATESTSSAKPSSTTVTWMPTSSSVTSSPTPTEPPSFLVQPRKNNPEKWAPLLSNKKRQRLRKLCWETMFGQEIIKLTVMDMVVTVATIVIGDYIRALVVRFFNGCCCWDLEKQFPGYPDFKIAENILHLVNNQGMIWMGMFFSPGLPALNTLKLVILLYVRSWAVITSNVPPETVFKASNNNNFYLLFLLTMLFLCTLPVGYAVVWVEPSWHCGPFSDYPRIYQLATSTLIGGLPSSLYPVIDYISSPGVVIPAGLLLVLIIYYLLSLTAALREANSDLRDQLRHERSAEKRKALNANSGKGRPETPTTRWARVIPLTPMPRPRLDATSDPEKPAIKKSPTALSPEGDSVPLIPLSDPSRGKDEGPWPDDVTDLGHSEVFDDSLSEPRKGVKDTSNKYDAGINKQESKKHEKERRKDSGKEIGSGPRSPYPRTKHRHNSYPQGAKDEDEISLSKLQRGKHRAQSKANRMSQERKQSDESNSPTKAKPFHKQIIDSPKERKRKGSGPQSSKLKKKMPEECVHELNEILQQETKLGKSPRAINKVELWKAAEPVTRKKVAPQARHQHELSILKTEDLNRSSQSKNDDIKNETQSSHHCSSSDDSQSMQTIPVIKISKEDSVERSLQQAKLERQKTLEEDSDVARDHYSVSTTDTTSTSSKKYEDSLEMKVAGQDQLGKIILNNSQTKPAPTETDLDDPFILDFTDIKMSKTTAHLGKNKKDKLEDKMEEDKEDPVGTLDSDEEVTLLGDLVE